MLMPYFSIILPVYNVEAYLERCIQSVCDQDFLDYEIILVDDGSTDNSYKILENYSKLDPRIKILTQNNQFAGVARNNGMHIAKGEYLIFLDSDDFFSPELLNELYGDAVQNNSDIVLCDGYYYDNITTEKTHANVFLQKGNIPQKQVFSYVDIPEKIMHITIDCPWNKLFKKFFIENYELVFQPLRSANDVYFVDSALILADRISVVDKRLITYRKNIKTSLQANRNKEPLNFYTAISAVKTKILQYDRYKDVEKSILSLFVTACRSHLHNAKTYDEYKLLYQFYNQTAFKEWSISEKEKKDYVYVSEYYWIKEIQKLNLREYLELYPMVKKWPTDSHIILDLLPKNVYGSEIPKVIVTLTTFPARIDTVYLVIENILNQTIIPDKIILYLAIEQFPRFEADLPLNLLKYVCTNELSIKWCDEDLRSHKKYYYAMQEFKNDIIITVDDDLIYENDMIEQLLGSYKAYPYAVSAMRTHLITKDDNGNIAAYKNWGNEYSGIVGIPSMQLFATTGAGTLFPPHCLSEHTFDIEQIKSLCFYADDIWLKVMQILVNTPVVLVRPNRELKYIPETQNERLYEFNVINGGNDLQFKNVIEFYDKKCNVEIKSEIKIFSNYISKCNNEIVVEDTASTTIKMRDEIDQKNKTIDYYSKELENIKNGYSFKIGRVITFIPRKLHGCIRCYKEHGVKYTAKRAMEHLGIPMGIELTK